MKYLAPLLALLLSMTLSFSQDCLSDTSMSLIEFQPSCAVFVGQARPAGFRDTVIFDLTAHVDSIPFVATASVVVGYSFCNVYHGGVEKVILMDTACNYLDSADHTTGHWINYPGFDITGNTPYKLKFIILQDSCGVLQLFCPYWGTQRKLLEIGPPVEPQELVEEIELWWDGEHLSGKMPGNMPDRVMIDFIAVNGQRQTEFISTWHMFDYICDLLIAAPAGVYYIGINPGYGYKRFKFVKL